MRASLAYVIFAAVIGVASLLTTTFYIGYTMAESAGKPKVLEMEKDVAYWKDNAEHWEKQYDRLASDPDISKILLDRFKADWRRRENLAKRASYTRMDDPWPRVMKDGSCYDPIRGMWTTEKEFYSEMAVQRRRAIINRDRKELQDCRTTPFDGEPKPMRWSSEQKPDHRLEDISIPTDPVAETPATPIYPRKRAEERY